MTFLKKIKSLSIGKTFFERVAWITEKSWSCAVGNRDRTNHSGFLSQARDKNTFKKKLYLFTRARSTLWSLIVYHMYIHILYMTILYYIIDLNVIIPSTFISVRSVRRLLETTHALYPLSKSVCVLLNIWWIFRLVLVTVCRSSHLVESLLQEP
jgi:hypothetical protein